MENKTKYDFALALINLIEIKPLEKITVKEITEKAGLTRQTFYRNFLDKYDLVNWYFEILCMQSFKEMGVSCTLKEGLIKKFEFIKSQKNFFTEAFLHDTNNYLIDYDYNCIYNFYLNIIKKKTTEFNEDLDFLLKMYCKGSIDMTIEWVKMGMVQDINKIVDLLIESLPARLKVFLIELE